MHNQFLANKENYVIQYVYSYQKIQKKDDIINYNNEDHPQEKKDMNNKHIDNTKKEILLNQLKVLSRLKFFWIPLLIVLLYYFSPQQNLYQSS